ncbi:MAG TPA: 3'-5' exonuclease [Anaerovoracaceae bacterium]|nr:3'-5' exonuclease [Anaerovoracaceae bacterium]
MGLEYYVIDTETTGFSPGWHEMTQISIIRCSDRHQLSKLIKAEYPKRVSPQALEVTNRTMKDLLVGDTRANVVEAVDSFLLSDGLTDEHRCMIAHNAPFDKNFCHALWASVGKKFPAICWLDTKTFAKLWANKLGLEKPKLTLAASMENVGLKPIDPGIHNAISDSRNTYLLWKRGMDEGLDHLACIKRYPHEE